MHIMMQLHNIETNIGYSPQSIPKDIYAIQTYIKSPLNYIGGKHKILNQIIPLFPNNIRCFVDLFAGGCNVGINVNAEKIIFNDNLIYLIDLYKKLQIKPIEAILKHIYTQIERFQLSKTNELGYNQLRLYYNKAKNPLDLLVLIAYSFNHQIRFNNNHEFNNPFGKNRSSYNPNIERNLINFIMAIQSNNAKFNSLLFENYNFELLSSHDLVYCDPPYLITTGTYNDGKRGFNGWGDKDELKLLAILDYLNDKGIRFALSNVIKHKDKENHILQNWLNKNQKYNVHYLEKDYSNSNYQIIDKNKHSSIEVLVTNYS